MLDTVVYRADMVDSIITVYSVIYYTINSGVANGGPRGHLPLPPPLYFQDITYNTIYKILRQNIALKVFRAGKYHSKAERNSLFFCDKPITDFERALRSSLD